MTDSVHRVRLGSLILSDGGDDDANGTDYRFAVLGDDFTTGDPQPVEVTIRSLLQDGSLVTRTRDDNREASFRVTITAPDSVTLGAGAAALVAETNKRNEFGFTPPDGWGVETVYDVVTSSLTRVQDDLAEVQRLERTYLLRLVCEPFGRPNAMVSAAAVTPPPAVTPASIVIDDGSTTTHWTGRIGTLTDQGSFLRVMGSKSPRADWTGSVDLTTYPYISIAAHISVPAISGFYSPLSVPLLTVNGVAATLLSVNRISGTSFNSYTFKTTQTTVTKIEFGDTLYSYNTALEFYALTASNVPSLSGTARQTSGTVAVAGSARTQGSFAISHASSGLGTVLLYTLSGPGYLPSLRQYRSSGVAPTSDTSTVSGARTVIGSSSETYDIPVSQILAGNHQLLARLRLTSGSGSSTITWGAQVRSAAGANLGSSWSGTTTVALTSTFAVFVLGNLQLSLVDLPATSTAVVRISITGSATATEIDDGWFFNLDEGCLTWLEAGSHQRAWVDSATLSRPRPAWFVGDASDRSDAFNTAGTVRAAGVHEFVPPFVSSFVVTTGALGATATLTHYPRSPYEADGA